MTTRRSIGILLLVLFLPSCATKWTTYSEGLPPAGSKVRVTTQDGATRQWSRAYQDGSRYGGLGEWTMDGPQQEWVPVEEITSVEVREVNWTKTGFIYLGTAATLVVLYLVVGYFAFPDAR
jgi:hypothetical protein